MYMIMDKIVFFLSCIFSSFEFLLWFGLVWFVLGWYGLVVFLVFVVPCGSEIMIRSSR